MKRSFLEFAVFLLVGGALRREAIAAIHGFVAARLEGYFRVLTACAARHGEHFARTAAPVCSSRSAEASCAALSGLARRAAIRTPVGFVLKSFAREELLFSGAEDKLRATVGAGQVFIGIQSESPLMLFGGWFRLATYWTVIRLCRARVRTLIPCEDSSMGIKVTQAQVDSKRIMSGTRPTGRMHLGHLVGALGQWAQLCRMGDAFFEIADLHALTTRFESPGSMRDDIREMVLDWLAAGVDPEHSTIYLQSRIPEISELQVLLGMITPVSWLQRVPTYKDQIAQLGRGYRHVRFFGYPLLQLADIVVMRGDVVPVGKDQLSHLELGREVVRRFNHLYGPTLQEPQAVLSAVPGSSGHGRAQNVEVVWQRDRYCG